MPASGGPVSNSPSRKALPKSATYGLPLVSRRGPPLFPGSLPFLAIFAVAVALRVYRLDEFPKGLLFDPSAEDALLWDQRARHVPDEEAPPEAELALAATLSP